MKIIRKSNSKSFPYIKNIVNGLDRETDQSTIFVVEGEYELKDGETLILKMSIQSDSDLKWFNEQYTHASQNYVEK